MELETTYLEHRYTLILEPGLISAPASNTLLVPSRLAFLQRSASGTALRLQRLANASH